MTACILVVERRNSGGYLKGARAISPRRCTSVRQRSSERRKISRERLTYFKAVGALNALNEIETHINDFTDTSTIRLLEKVEDDMINLFEEVTGVKIPNSIS